MARSRHRERHKGGGEEGKARQSMTGANLPPDEALVVTRPRVALRVALARGFWDGRGGRGRQRVRDVALLATALGAEASHPC